MTVPEGPRSSGLSSRQHGVGAQAETSSEPGYTDSKSVRSRLALTCANAAIFGVRPHVKRGQPTRRRRLTQLRETRKRGGASALVLACGSPKACAWLKLIMKVSPAVNQVKLDFHLVRAR